MCTPNSQTQAATFEFLPGHSLDLESSTPLGPARLVNVIKMLMMMAMKTTMITTLTMTPTTTTSTTMI